ncbi:hypothetical protein HMN09_00218900 [Mycena chlorophos]|uniref:Uncharacterized protein n=1 Tax=Mycena chlorophos TaxID=658473 RepID=A0A8H6TNC5_MYCCL|nr:hypothetical protein HMN09_00218900 [Mycena chlorophos]
MNGYPYPTSLLPWVHDLLENTQRVRLLALYAKLCKLCAIHVGSRPPTTVQLLLADTPTDARMVLSASLAWFKTRHHFQLARSSRAGILRELWGSTGALVHPTPMQARFPGQNQAGSLFGTCWGDCAEAVSLAALNKHIASGIPLRTLAVNVACLNAPDPVTGRSAADLLLEHPYDRDLDDVLDVLTRSNALRAMCENCEHLIRVVGADVVDCAHDLHSQSTVATSYSDSSTESAYPSFEELALSMAGTAPAPT